MGFIQDISSMFISIHPECTTITVLYVCLKLRFSLKPTHFTLISLLIKIYDFNFSHQQFVHVATIQAVQTRDFYDIARQQ